MKKLLLMSLLIMFVSNIFAQSRVVEYPTEGAKSTSTISISKVELLEDQTNIYFDVKIPPKNWFRIAKDTYIVVDNDKSYQLQSADGITIDKKFTVDQTGEHKFSLSFGAIPQDSKILDFDERVNNGYKIVDICISDEEVQRPVEKNLMGDWFSTDGASKYLLGIKDSVVLYGNDIWRYADLSSQQTKGVIDLVHFKDPSQTLTLHYKMGKKGVVLFGESKKDLQPLTQSRIFDNNYTIPKSLTEEWTQESFLSPGKAVIRGYLGDYSAKLGVTRAVTYARSPFAEDSDNMKLIRINSDGTFETQVDLLHPTEVGIRYENMFIGVLVSPGDTLTMSLPLNAIQKMNYAKRICGIEYMGDNGLLNAQIARYVESRPDYDPQKYYKELDVEGYKVHLNERWESEMSYLKNYIDTTKLTPNAERMISNLVKLEMCENLKSYRSQRAYHLKANMNELDIPDSFYDKYQELPLDDFALLANSNYYFFLNGLQYFNVQKWSSQENFNKYLESKCGDLSSLDGEENAYSPLFYAETSLENYRSLGLDHSFAIDIIMLCFGRSHAVSFTLFENTKPYEEYLELIDSPIIKQKFIDYIAKKRVESIDQTIEYRVKRALAKAEAEKLKEEGSSTAESESTKPKSEPKTTPKTEVKEGEISESEKIIFDCLEPLRGQIVVLYFWAMWCSPCRDGMINSYKHKDALTGYNVGFAYITTEQYSPKSTREKFLGDNEIEGLSVIITRDEWATISAEYNISCIPRYMLIGKDGRVIDAKYNIYDIDYPKLKEMAGAKEKK